MLKICVVGPSKYFFSGLSAHTIFLANALSNQAEISVILLRKLLPRFLYPGKKHLNRSDYLISLKEGLAAFEGMDWNSPLSWIKSIHFLRHHRPDAIILLQWTSAVAHMQLLLVIINRLLIKARLIFEIHELVDPLEEQLFPIKIYSKLSGWLLLRSAHAYTVHSDSMRDMILHKNRFKPEKVYQVPFGLYSDYKLDYDKKSALKDLGIAESFVILCFGSIRRYKGVRFLVAAFSTLPVSIGHNSRLIIAGEDWGDDPEIKPLIEASPYRFKITFNSQFVADRDIPRYFSAADVVVLPYLRSCGSGVIHIAMAYGKPIVTSNIEALRSDLKDYQGAYFSPVGDVLSLRENILKIYQSCQQNKNLLYPIPENDWDKIVKGYVTLIDELKKRRIPRTPAGMGD